MAFENRRLLTVSWQFDDSAAAASEKKKREKKESSSAFNAWLRWLPEGPTGQQPIKSSYHRTFSARVWSGEGAFEVSMLGVRAKLPHKWHQGCLITVIASKWPLFSSSGEWGLRHDGPMMEVEERQIREDGDIKVEDGEKKKGGRGGGDR